ncbi:unnamed protein product [Cyprideis torosa]|uniref:Uncharacterized protein n=1 Tax=Cyprideis torosa TaxID=163714 RepID=A0A7R8WE28_9CRUS|nr:unnamed protein product [Cyprideis torosa]CAG0889246.1 unnamed protein product [Cyprideis torosa]
MAPMTGQILCVLFIAQVGHCLYASCGGKIEDPVGIPDNGEATVSANCRKCFSPDYVTARINITHSYSKDLLVTLIARPSDQSALVVLDHSTSCTPDSWVGVVIEDNGEGGYLDQVCTTGDIKSPPSYLPLEPFSIFTDGDPICSFDLIVKDTLYYDTGYITWFEVVLEFDPDSSTLDTSSTTPTTNTTSTESTSMQTSDNPTVNTSTDPQTTEDVTVTDSPTTGPTTQTTEDVTVTDSPTTGPTTQTTEDVTVTDSPTTGPSTTQWPTDTTSDTTQWPSTTMPSTTAGTQPPPQLITCGRDFDPPIDIPDNGEVFPIVLKCPACLSVQDVSISLILKHTFSTDLRMKLVHEDRSAMLKKNGGPCATQNYWVTITDNATELLQEACPSPDHPDVVGEYRPLEALSRFTGASTCTPWTLELQDVVVEDTGFVNSVFIDVWATELPTETTSTTSGPATTDDVTILL